MPPDISGLTVSEREKVVLAAPDDASQETQREPEIQRYQYLRHPSRALQETPVVYPLVYPERCRWSRVDMGVPGETWGAG